MPEKDLGPSNAVSQDKKRTIISTRNRFNILTNEDSQYKTVIVTANDTDNTTDYTTKVVKLPPIFVQAVLNFSAMIHTVKNMILSLTLLTTIGRG